MSDFFKAGTALGDLGVLAVLGIAVVVLAWLAYKAYQREIARADRGMALAEAATAQFERALDVIEKMQDRRRSTDEVRRPRV